MSDYRIRLLHPADLLSYAAHEKRHRAESGSGGDVIFMPYSRSHVFDESERYSRMREQWEAPLDTTHWQRIWGAWHGNHIIAHVKLLSSGIATSSHRVDLELGIERPHRQRGLGTKLIATAVDFARTEVGAEYVDLSVFAHNTPALNLYRKLGFREIGRMADKFRVDGTVIDDVMMTLPLH